MICKRKSEYTNIQNVDLESIYLSIYLSILCFPSLGSDYGSGSLAEAEKIHFTGGTCGLVAVKSVSLT